MALHGLSTWAPLRARLPASAASSYRSPPQPPSVRPRGRSTNRRTNRSWITAWSPARRSTRCRGCPRRPRDEPEPDEPEPDELDSNEPEGGYKSCGGEVLTEVEVGKAASVIRDPGLPAPT
jgi:hypothetical protein